jgi:superfamily II DNA/RNA helicase
MKFTNLGLAPELQRAISDSGYVEMTPVQQKGIVAARRKKDLLVNAQTGTGKTAAFALPILQMMLDAPKPNVSASPRALILSPTRELAEQLGTTIQGYAKYTELSVQAVYGGVKMGGQKSKLTEGVDVLIATPGRLLEHLSLNNLNLTNIEWVVLDEADRMLDMGFLTDVQTILQHASQKHQTLLYSATSSPAVNELSHKILNNHSVIKIDKLNTTAATVTHSMYPVEESRKIELFKRLLKQHNWFQVMVFTSTKQQADALMAALKKAKVNAAVCHGDKSQGYRKRVIADFKSAKLQVLISTDVAARGLDIQGLDHVINFNLPYLPEDYVHRIGRTGRAGNTGEAISFVSREEENTVAKIERLINSKIKRVNQPGFEVSNRVSLLKSAQRRAGAGRSNKATATQISIQKVQKQKNKKAKR